MCRLLGWAAREPATVHDALGRAELDGFTALSRRHADGWGIARWPQAASPAGAPPLVDRSLEAAAKDPKFAELATTAAADAGLVHLRWATPGLQLLPANTHPFVHGEMAFAHNGSILPLSRLDELVPPGWSAPVGGTTDSERYFVAVAERLSRGEAMSCAVATVVRRIFRDFQPSSLNAMLLTPEALYVVSASDPTRGPSICETSEDDLSNETDLAFYDLKYRVSRDAVVVASSGFEQPASAGWQPLGNMTLLRIERTTLATSTVSLEA